ncbi:cell wall / vacuolar inhibitor of fructosidase 2 [Euphorbia peplus]|nr:cell wall / vacuolar inhibitor of fructosidase 2 [Euphorbia peplus]
MAPNQTFLTLFLILIQFILITQSRKYVKLDANTIDGTCKQTPYYSQCVKLLNSDPKSLTADVKGLALILVDMLKKESTKSIQSLKDIQKQRPDLKEQLDSCASKYDTILNSDVTVANEAIQLGNPKFAEGALNDAALEADLCEKRFKAGTSPLSEPNKRMADISRVAASITRQLL